MEIPEDQLRTLASIVEIGFLSDFKRGTAFAGPMYVDWAMDLGMKLRDLIYSRMQVTKKESASC